MLAALLIPVGVEAQTRAGVTGRILEAETRRPLEAATVTIDGTEIGAFSDSTGRYRLIGVPAGPQVLVVRRIGFATARVSVTVPSAGVLARDVELATSALQLSTLQVTANPAGRARGELGTASVIDRDAIQVQTTTSLAGILELVPGVEIQPPGLGSVQQFGLRSVPTGTVASLAAGGPSPADLASFGTLIILDGVPLSNNANLQATGPRGEFSLGTSAGGGIDLRRIPAATLERVEVLRGIPSARYGDLTQGVIIVETRAGAFAPEARGLFDPFSGGGNTLGGWSFGGQALSGSFDLVRTRVDPGFSDESSYRFASQLAHRAELGGESPLRPRLTLDSRVDAYQVHEERPEDPEVAPGRSSSNRDRGVRVSERARLRLEDGARVELTGALDLQSQRSMRELPRSRGAMPFSDRLEEGRAYGRYIGGEYRARMEMDGDAWNLFTRLEGERPGAWLGLDHRLRAGMELRREWNSGAGYQFDMEFPPQSSFNGVQGFDRPRPFDAIPALASSAFYVDERILHVLPGGVGLDLQVGARLDVLHEGEWWASGARDALAQPRVNLQLAPASWLRLRGAAGTTAKLPTLAQLHPAPQYFDLVNVNWFTNDPVERLAVLTTFIRDPSNPELGLSRGRKAEAGLELSNSGGDASLAVVAFSDRTSRAVGFRQVPTFLVRDRYALRDSVLGDGLPTEIVEPPVGGDTIPVLLDVPANDLALSTAGIEVTARLPEIAFLRTRLEVQGAWAETRMERQGVDFGLQFGAFQQNAAIARAPYWQTLTQTGHQGLVTYRAVHHQPQVGLVVTATVQHVFSEARRTLGDEDTLAWTGYITRSGRLVPVAREQRVAPEYADIRRARSTGALGRTTVAPDWVMSLQVSLDMPLDGRLSFYAFNVLDRSGTGPSRDRLPRYFPPLQFGVEGSLPLGGRGEGRVVAGGGAP